MRTAGAALAAVLVAGVLYTSGPAGAQSNTDVYFVSGINDEDQSAPGGSSSTLCVDGEQVEDDLQFGDIVGPFDFETGATVNLVLYDGAGVDCSTPGGATEIINDDRTPEERVQVYVSAQELSGSGNATFTPIPFSIDCKDGLTDGEIAVVHGSWDTGEIEMLVDGSPEGTAEFGRTIETLVEVGDRSVTVNAGGSPIVGPLTIEAEQGVRDIVYVVGNLDDSVNPATPTVALTQELLRDDCPEEEQPVPPPPTPSTTAPTTAPPAPGTSAPNGPSQATGAPVAVTG